MLTLKKVSIPVGWNALLKKRYSKLSTKETWKGVVGLEIHAQIQSRSKLFSGSSTDFISPINSNVSLFDAAVPGTLPVINVQCVEAGVLTAIALNCRVNPVSMFDRKHYFYADLPAGYQITQQRAPLATGGILQFQVYTPGIHKTIYNTESHIKQIQLEQDSGKSLHDEDRSLLDLNRAGIPLMELVFEPDLKDGEEAAALVKELIVILQKLETCSCKMEEGALRVDANVSVHRAGEPFGVRAEIKNIGSIRGVAAAINYEIQRQVELLEKGIPVINETRTWNAENKLTVAMRDKEKQQDYRYMPEPNLLPLFVATGPNTFGCVKVEDLMKSLPELPNQTRIRLKNDYGLTTEQAIILVNNSKLLMVFNEAISKQKADPRLIVNLLINDFLFLLNKRKLSLDNVIINGEYLKETIDLYTNETINRQTARLLINEMLPFPTHSPTQLIFLRNWFQINDDDEIETLCRNVMESNLDMIKQYKNGKVKVFTALLGKVFEKSEQRANMKKASIILKDILNK